MHRIWRDNGTSRFWFQSFQNWQSEYLSLAAMVACTIFLRQQGSPESKPVDAAHRQTGGWRARTHARARYCSRNPRPTVPSCRRSPSKRAT
jgi:hypothetical protein